MWEIAGLQIYKPMYDYVSKAKRESVPTIQELHII